MQSSLCQKKTQRGIKLITLFINNCLSNMRRALFPGYIVPCAQQLGLICCYASGCWITCRHVSDPNYNMVTMSNELGAFFVYLFFPVGSAGTLVARVLALFVSAPWHGCPQHRGWCVLLHGADSQGTPSSRDAWGGLRSRMRSVWPFWPSTLYHTRGMRSF